MENQSDTYHIVWEGSQFVHHSLAHVNRELCLALLDSKRCDLSIRLYERHEFNIEEDPKRFALLAECFDKQLKAPPEFHIRHHWPPNFTPPEAGYWIMMLPWEYGSMPKTWLSPINTFVDEVWVYTNFIKDCYIHDGLDPERICTIPLSVDFNRFHPQISPWNRIDRLTQKKFKFLFVGGTFWRKGIDILLEAYRHVFRNTDDVSLIIKEVGVDTVYKNDNSKEQIKAITSDPTAPEVIYLTETFSEADMPLLYASCDCLVHPYRGEGFGLPIAEAMACGLPVIIPRGGAADDFTSSETTYYVSSDWMKIKLDVPTVHDAYVLNINAKVLSEMMHHVVCNPEEARSKGALASRAVRRHLSWKNSAAVIWDRLAKLTKKPIRRISSPCQQSLKKPIPQPPRVLSAQALNKEGLKHLNQGNIEQAELHFARAAQLDASFAEPYIHLSKIYQQKKYLKPAFSCIAEALRIQPHNQEAIASLHLFRKEISNIGN